MAPPKKWLRNSVDKGETILARERPAILLTIASGRVRVVKMQALGKEIVLEIFGADGPVGTLSADPGRAGEV